MKDRVYLRRFLLLAGVIGPRWYRYLMASIGYSFYTLLVLHVISSKGDFGSLTEQVKHFLFILHDVLGISQSRDMIPTPGEGLKLKVREEKNWLNLYSSETPIQRAQTFAIVKEKKGY
jgi:hypothetical protein